MSGGKSASSPGSYHECLKSALVTRYATKQVSAHLESDHELVSSTFPSSDILFRQMPASSVITRRRLFGLLRLSNLGELVCLVVLWEQSRKKKRETGDGISEAIWFHIHLGGYSGVGCIGPFFLTIDKYDYLL
jgi:hypothetical protein